MSSELVIGNSSKRSSLIPQHGRTSAMISRLILRTGNQTEMNTPDTYWRGSKTLLSPCLPCGQRITSAGEPMFVCLQNSTELRQSLQFNKSFGGFGTIRSASALWHTYPNITAWLSLFPSGAGLLALA